MSLNDFLIYIFAGLLYKFKYKKIKLKTRHSVYVVISLPPSHLKLCHFFS